MGKVALADEMVDVVLLISWRKSNYVHIHVCNYEDLSCC